jgi:hypothetical protein
MLEGLIIVGLFMALALTAVFFGVNTRDANDWCTHNEF